MAYKDLNIRERAAIIHTAVQNGLTRLSDIKEAYNSFAEGGQMSNQEGNIHSTGGPLYPFSFSRAPLPSVRY